MLALTGFIMMAIIIGLLFMSKVLPLISFIVVPMVAALVLGYTPAEIAGFAQIGVLNNARTGILFVFSIIFFGVISDTGMFDRIIKRLVKRAGRHIVAVTVITVVIATIGHIDGSIATTLLITIPAMLPLYKKMNMDPLVLMCLCTASLGVMNLTPWGGHLNRVATVLDMDINLLWQALIPVQIAGLVLTLCLAVILGKREVRNGAGYRQGRVKKDIESGSKTLIIDELARPGLFWFNLALVVVTVLALALTGIQPFIIFMVSMGLALMVNYPDVKTQEERIKAHAGPALFVAQTLFGAGVLVGILNGSGMIDAMALSIVQIMPQALGRYLAVILGVLSTPFALVFCTDAYYFGILPVAANVGARFGIEPVSMGLAMLIGRNVALTISPLVATTILGCGLAGVKLNDHIRFSFKWLWTLSILLMVFSVVIGII